MDSKKIEKVKISIPSDLSGLFRQHHDGILADDSLADIDVILACIYFIENAKVSGGAEYGECKKMFVAFGRKEGNFRGNVFNAKKKLLIKDENGKLLFLISGLKKIEKIFGQIGKSRVFVVKSGANISAIKLFEEFLSTQIDGVEVLLCDSHIAPSTLFPFTILKGKIKVLRILTSNVYDLDKFKDYLKRLNKELGIAIEVRDNKKIHDRYIISSDSCWSIGSSIKDFGNKDTIIREINELTASMKELFKERWDEATPVC